MIVPVNDLPYIPVLRPSLTLTEDTSASLAGVFTIGDPDGDISITLQLSVVHGVLVFESVLLPDGTPAPPGNRTLQFHGAISHVLHLLSGNLTYVPDAEYSGRDALTITVRDPELHGTTAPGVRKTVEIFVAGVNDPPVVTYLTSSLTVREDEVCVRLPWQPRSPAHAPVPVPMPLATATIHFDCSAGAAPATAATAHCRCLDHSRHQCRIAAGSLPLQHRRPCLCQYHCNPHNCTLWGRPIWETWR